MRDRNQRERRACRKDKRATRAAFFAILACFSAAVSLGVVSPLYAQGDGAAKIRVIKPFIGYEEASQWGDVPEIISEGSKASDAADGALEYAWASDLFFEKQIWQLQFAYKNVRTIDVDYPTADGKLKTKRVWYMVYSVTNTGDQLKLQLDKEKMAQLKVNVSKTVIDGDGEEKKYEDPSNNLWGVYCNEENALVKYAAGDEEGAIEFVPRFVFATATIQDRLVYERKQSDGLFYGQTRGTEEGVYYDAFDPIAFSKIVRKEARRGQNILDSTRISNHKILPGETIWGVAVWPDVDPRIDKFSVYISGLTNALRWEVTGEPDADQVGAGRDVWRKVLKINFINPGDEAHSGKEIYNNLPGELDYEWIYL